MDYPETLKQSYFRSFSQLYSPECFTFLILFLLPIVIVYFRISGSNCKLKFRKGSPSWQRISSRKADDDSRNTTLLSQRGGIDTMSNSKNLVLSLLDFRFNQEVGFVPLMDAINGLTAEQASWQPTEKVTPYGKS
jgi:hypothetical protein